MSELGYFPGLSNMISRILGSVGIVICAAYYWPMFRRGLEWAIGYSDDIRPAWYLMIAIALLATVILVALVVFSRIYFGLVLDLLFFRYPRSGAPAKRFLILVPFVLAAIFFNAGILPPSDNRLIAWGFVGIFFFELIRRWDGSEREDPLLDTDGAGRDEK